MLYHDNLICGKVSQKIRKLTREYMINKNMSLYDAFDLAVRESGTKSAELRMAWYFSDYRKFIPCAYIPEYLDFKKYPLKYE